MGLLTDSQTVSCGASVVEHVIVCVTMDFDEELQLMESIRKKLTRDRTKRELGQHGCERAKLWVDKIAETSIEMDKQQKMILKYYCKQLFQQVEQGKLTTPFNRPPPKVIAYFASLHLSPSDT